MSACAFWGVGTSSWIGARVSASSGRVKPDALKESGLQKLLVQGMAR